MNEWKTVWSLNVTVDVLIMARLPCTPVYKLNDCDNMKEENEMVIVPDNDGSDSNDDDE
jgi:hypothetical protein